MGYLLIQSNNGDAGEKEKYIRKLLEHFRVTWEVRLLETLSDKDITEINAFLAELPVKHQLCFWHCLRAIKVRLAILARHPAFYDADEAFKEFDWIDKSFVPVNQITDIDVVRCCCMFGRLFKLTCMLGRPFCRPESAANTSP